MDQRHAFERDGDMKGPYVSISLGLHTGTKGWLDQLLDHERGVRRGIDGEIANRNVDPVGGEVALPMTGNASIDLGVSAREAVEPRRQRW
jgi:hypothetical protein